MPRKKSSGKIAKKSKNVLSLWDKLNYSAENNQSRLSMVLGALIILVVGILVFNYFNRQVPNLGPSQQTESIQDQDVLPDSLPGKYKVKEGDTLFSIAEKYYRDGYKYTELASTNNLIDPDILETGQTLDIPKLSVNPPTVQASQGTEPATVTAESEPKDTIWGPAITQDTYTVIEGDWLSKIAERAYGDTLAFEKIAQANDIPDPNLIETGTVLKLPR